MNNVKEIVVSVFSVAIKIIFIVIAGMFIYKYALIAFDYGYRIFSEEPMTSGEGRVVEITVKSDMDAEDIGTLLENKGLIRDALLFRIQERVSENHGKIQPGTYELNTAMTAEEMISVMAKDAPEIEEEEQELHNPMAEEEVVFTDEDEMIPPDIEGYEVEGEGEGEEAE